MAKKIFISYAAEDKELKEKLVDQAGNSEAEFVDLPEKDPADNDWKENSRNKIKDSDGVLIIVTRNTRNAGGQLWEAECAGQEGKPQKGVWGNFEDTPVDLPKELDGLKIIKWDKDNLNTWIESL